MRDGESKEYSRRKIKLGGMKTRRRGTAGSRRETVNRFPGYLLLITCYLLLSIAAFAQEPSQYHVVRVVGSVQSPALNRSLKTGDVIQPKDQLKFDTKESYIIVNSPQTGRKRISGVPDSSPREFLQLLQSFVQPELRSTSTRHISMEYVESLQSSMAFDTLLVLGDGFIPVNTAKLSLAKPAIIRAWYTDDKKKRVYRPISDTRGFFLNSKAVHSEHHHGRVVIEYFEDEKEEPMFTPGTLLGTFVPMYVDEASLVTEIKALLSARDQSRTAMAEINAYLREEYAPAQEDNLAAWLKAKGIAIE